MNQAQKFSTSRMTQGGTFDVTNNDQSSNNGTIKNKSVSGIEEQPLLSTSNDQSNLDDETSTLSPWSKYGFAVGHIYNDMCACLWFSYCLLFLQEILQLGRIEAGGLILFGQVVDACATPIVGYLLDKFATKQKWHIFGKL